MTFEGVRASLNPRDRDEIVILLIKPERECPPRAKIAIFKDHNGLRSSRRIVGPDAVKVQAACLAVHILKCVQVILQRHIFEAAGAFFLNKTFYLFGITRIEGIEEGLDPFPDFPLRQNRFIIIAFLARLLGSHNGQSQQKK